MDCNNNKPSIGTSKVQKCKRNYFSASIPNIKISRKEEASDNFEVKPLEQSKLDLSELNKIQNELNDQKVKLNEKNTAIHFRKASIWTILIYFVIFVIVIYKIYNLIRKRKISKKREPFWCFV